MKGYVLSLMLMAECMTGFSQQGPVGRMIPGKKGLFFKRHTIEVRGLYGKWTAPDVVDAIGESVVNGTIPSVSLSDFNVVSGGVYGGSIILFPDNKLSIGADFLVNANNSNATYTSPGGPGSSTRSYDMKYTSIMGRVDYHYINFHHFKLYGSTAIGASWRSATTGSFSNSKTGFAYQFTPIGVAVGGTVAAWAELGFGYRGILSAGVAVRF